jgi:hypothetical protein
MKRPDGIPGLEPLEPPAGGVERLRVALAGRERRRVVARRLAWASAAASIAAVLLLVLHRPAGRAAAWPGSGEAGPALVALGLAEPPGSAVAVSERSRGRVALLPVVASGEVLYYRIASLDDAGR